MPTSGTVRHREEVLATLATVSDFSYAWGIIDAYTPVLQAQVIAPKHDQRVAVSSSYSVRRAQVQACNLAISQWSLVAEPCSVSGSM